MNYDNLTTIAQMYGFALVSHRNAPAGKSYLIDSKAMKVTDLSKQSNPYAALHHPPASLQTLNDFMGEVGFYYGSFDPLQGTPWGAAADRFEEAVAAAGTELEWR